MQTPVEQIIGAIAQNHAQQIEHLQTGAWQGQVDILQRELKHVLNLDPSSYIFFEFMIPRMGKRADVVLISAGIVFVIEFKVGANRFSSADVNQAHGYALDLKNFHQGSHEKLIIPILLASKAQSHSFNFTMANDQVASPILIGPDGLLNVIHRAVDTFSPSFFCAFDWSKKGYKPTPTIIEAAQALYRNHSVEDISRSDASAKNMAKTSNEILEIIHQSRLKKRKSICFVTGVPGAGKTLVGLNIATQHANIEDDEHAVFLSGNGPLVEVLREALARDEAANSIGVTKAAAFRKASQFIQNIHHFRDTAIVDNTAPCEKVVIFDEAQRAWNKEQASKFMQSKKGKKNFNQSEPEFLIEVMDKHQDWCVVVALIGGGQEINTGEAGIVEWLNAVTDKFSHWDAYYSTELTTEKYVTGSFNFARSPTIAKSNLHLSTSMRSFRTENLSEMVHYLIAGDAQRASQIYQLFDHLFPIKMTRNLSQAKSWIESQVRANETKGMIASSGAIRLKPEGIFVKNHFQAKEWFLNDATDIRACHYLEDVATEFDIQGLELDWCLVGWDADYRFNGSQFEHWRFVGTRWQQRKKAEDQQYLANAYRVLLTRARQGMVIFIPQGSETDLTRQTQFYQLTYAFLQACGIEEI
ncbi:DUF2075 domain-containing protein [Motilimonas cestriensis]|uniref:DUF2075 domain-containing protein n=1 Tax=Motilimonas cestriensis TaxID=2742685 RepID=UPI001E645085|nr:DUF2075 domain-containing protein [Motilimonas cestriensis]